MTDHEAWPRHPQPHEREPPTGPDETGYDAHDIAHAIASGATTRQMEEAFSVGKATVNAVRRGHRQRIAWLRRQHSSARAIKAGRREEAAASERAQAAMNDPDGYRGTEVRNDLAPIGWALRTRWLWAEGTLRVQGETVFAKGTHDNDWRSRWCAIATTSTGAEVSLTAFDGKGIDALLEATPRRGDVLFVRNAEMNEDWTWTVFAGRGTTIDNLGTDAGERKPTVQARAWFDIDISPSNILSARTEHPRLSRV